MSTTIAIANHKGGVAKTTTCLNLGHALAERGQKVLLCDLDPQSSLTISLGLDVRELPSTIYDVLLHFAGCGPPGSPRWKRLANSCPHSPAQSRANPLDWTTRPPDSEPCYLSVRQLAAHVPYAEQTIRNLMHSGELVEGQHYFKRRGRVIFSWPAMRAWVEQQSAAQGEQLPLVRNRRNGRSE